MEPVSHRQEIQIVESCYNEYCAWYFAMPAGKIVIFALLHHGTRSIAVGFDTLPVFFENICPAFFAVHGIGIFRPVFAMPVEPAMNESYPHCFIFQGFKGNSHLACFFGVGYGYPGCTDLPGKSNMFWPFKFDHPSPVAAKIIGANLKTMSVDVWSDSYFL